MKAAEENAVTLPAQRVERYGQMVWELSALEPLRREACMCHRCSQYAPGTKENCLIAEKFYAICKEHGNAFILTRCGSWRPRRADQDDQTGTGK
jgi:hypothetical protein